MACLTLGDPEPVTLMYGWIHQTVESFKAHEQGWFKDIFEDL